MSESWILPPWRDHKGTNKCSVFVGMKNRMKRIAPEVFFFFTFNMCNIDPIFIIDGRYRHYLNYSSLTKKWNKTYLTEVIVNHYV